MTAEATPRQHPATGATQTRHALLDGAAATPLWSLTGPEAAQTAGDLERLSAKVAALPARHLRTAPLVLGGASPPLDLGRERRRTPGPEDRDRHRRPRLPRRRW